MRPTDSQFDDPWAAPETPAEPRIVHHVELRPILVIWEKLRIAYNLVLAAEVCLFWLMNPGLIDGPDAIEIIGGCALIANLCYFAGPVLDVYSAFIFNHRLRLAWVLFPVGMFFSMFLTAVVLGQLEFGEF